MEELWSRRWLKEELMTQKTYRYTIIKKISWAMYGLGVLGLVGGLAAPAIVSATTSTFITKEMAKTDETLANPERGQYIGVGLVNNARYGAMYHVVSEGASKSRDRVISTLDSYLSQQQASHPGMTVVKLEINVFDFTTIVENSGTLNYSISEEDMESMQTVFDLIRAKGLKVVVSPALNIQNHEKYRWIKQQVCPEGCYNPTILNSTFMVQMYRDVLALFRDVFDENKDVIMMGVLENRGNADYVQDISLDVVQAETEALLEAMPSSKTVNVDELGAARKVLGSEISMLEKDKAFSGLKAARIGSNDGAEDEWSLNQSLYTFNDKTYTRNADSGNIEYVNYNAEYAKRNHVSLFDANSGAYAQAFGEGGIRETELGYRLSLNSVQAEVNEGRIKAQVVLDNDGDGYLVGEKKTTLVLANKTGTQEIELGADIRRLADYQAGKYNLNFEGEVPAGFDTKNMEVYLRIAEPYESLSEHDNYFVKLANEGIYNKEHKANYLGILMDVPNAPETGGDLRNARAGIGEGHTQEILLVFGGSTIVVTAICGSVARKKRIGFQERK